MCLQLINWMIPRVIFDAATNELIKIARKDRKKIPKTLFSNLTREIDGHLLLVLGIREFIDYFTTKLSDIVSRSTKLHSIFNAN